MPSSPVSSGSDSAGRPVRVHSEQKTGLPVASPLGATPGAAGVRIASYCLKISAMSGGIAPGIVARSKITHGRNLRPSARKSRNCLLEASPPRSTTAPEIMRHIDRHDRAMVVPGARQRRPASRRRAADSRAARPSARTPHGVSASALSHTGVRTKANFGGNGGSLRRASQGRPARPAAAWRRRRRRSRRALQGSARHRRACGQIPRRDRARATASAHRPARSRPWLGLTP